MPQAVDTPTPPSKLDTLGVSVHHLQRVFLEKEVCGDRSSRWLLSSSQTSVRSSGTSAGSKRGLSRDSKIYQIENLQGPPGVIRKRSADTVCPLDGRMGAAYVHCLEGADHVGEATHMLSYSWGYTIGDIVDTLVDYCQQNKLNPKRTYIWICCLCVNQHRVVAKNKESEKSGIMVVAPEEVDFFSIFGDRVKRIGHLLAMMAPWNAPVYITRVWCVFEIYMAHTTNGCNVTIVMPPEQKLFMEQDVVNKKGGINMLYKTLGNTKVQDAKASVESDRLAILAKVRDDVGYSVLNDRVNNLLRGWMLEVLRQHRLGVQDLLGGNDDGAGFALSLLEPPKVQTVNRKGPARQSSNHGRDRQSTLDVDPTCCCNW